MFRQATVQDIAQRRITKLHGRIIVITRYYPRFLKRGLVHEYFPVLAPAKALLKEFKEKDAETGDHDAAFDRIAYESKFILGVEGIAVLRDLAAESERQSIYLVCHCRVGQRCHREIILLMARELFAAKISKLSFDWSTFSKRLAAGEFNELVTRK